ncbi:transketolase [Desulfocurvus sp.]|uniref:transketolase n=1 Tax=Desulfocurvus sp. TaxID=2871698 RepID=UPI0025C22A97|nr:transketolase [Desulfocurvus sp.]MCK9239931.1 transketolase [Desulfocurvus sp.]
MEHTTDSALDALAVSTLKGLIMDATRKANSGHPGGTMSSADMAYVLFKETLRFDPKDPAWFDRDRFVLSAGHESMLLYGLLHLRDLLDIDDLKAFRQWGSRTPGHPEHDATPGVEATTGPLGQGMSMAVGMAVAEAMLRHRLGEDICDHRTYALASDGDLQEPVALGSAALAGKWGLGRLTVLYDSNKMQLAGPTSRCDGTDYRMVFEGMGWQVLEIDGHDHQAIRAALAQARAEAARPTLIIGHTIMAKGAATLEGDYNTHGAPLAPEEIAATKAKLGLDPEKDFQVPAEVLTHFRSRFGHLSAESGKWHRKLTALLDSDPDFAALWEAVTARRPSLRLRWPEFAPGTQVATRKAWGAALNEIMNQLPLLAGGSADLDPSNQTVKFREAVGVFGPDNPGGRNLSFGVREFPMGAVLNGMALHGGIIPFGATFLTFSDYERNALRMSALQKLPVLHVFTHDSFYVGEDGPTHQPVEHVSSLRLIPNMLVLRPADANETNACLNIALTQAERPSCLMLTRQGLPVIDPAAHPAVLDGPARGGYVLADCQGEPEVVFLASGSEVQLVMRAAALLEGVLCRVVSVPSFELFDEQDAAYRAAVLPAGALKVAVEAGRPDLWHKYVGTEGIAFGLSHFGASAPAKDLERHYGFTPDTIADMVRARLG